MELKPRSPKYTVSPPWKSVSDQTPRRRREAHLLEEQQTIKGVEQLSTGLMDRSEDGLTVVGELAKELEDGPRTLRVEARRGFVEEDEEGGLGGEFDSDRETLALLDV